MEPVLWDGDYEKVFYYVHLPNGEKIKCWPNAGYMNSVDGSGRMWSVEDRITISVCEDDPYLRGAEAKFRCAVARARLEGMPAPERPPRQLLTRCDQALRPVLGRATFDAHRAERKRQKRERYTKRAKEKR